MVINTRTEVVTRVYETLSARWAGHTWSSVVMVGDRPPCTQKMRLSMSADRLHRHISPSAKTLIRNPPHFAGRGTPTSNRMSPFVSRFWAEIDCYVVYAFPTRGTTVCIEERGGGGGLVSGLKLGTAGIGSTRGPRAYVKSQPLTQHTSGSLTRWCQAFKKVRVASNDVINGVLSSLSFATGTPHKKHQNQGTPQYAPNSCNETHTGYENPHHNSCVFKYFSASATVHGRVRCGRYGRGEERMGRRAWQKREAAAAHLR